MLRRVFISSLLAIPVAIFLAIYLHYDWKKAVFPPKKYQDTASTSFTVLRPFVEVRRRLATEDLTTRLCEAQGGKVLYKKGAGFNARGPIKDWQLKLTREFAVSVRNKNYGDLILVLRQTVVLEKTTIKSDVVLVSPTGNLDYFSTNVTITEGSVGCIVDAQTTIEITEHVPESYDKTVRNELRKAVLESVKNFQDAFIRVVD